MSVSELSLYFDSAPANDLQLELLQEIKVDQTIGMAAEAELSLSIGVDRQGNWSGLSEEFVQLYKRVRVEIKVRNGDFIALVDGPIIAHRYELGSSPNNSKLVLVVQDDSVLMNQHERVEIYQDQTEEDIATSLFQDFGMDIDIDLDNNTTNSSGGLSRYIVQRGTAMHLLRELARRKGKYVYVKPGDIVGRSTGLFKRPDLSSGDFPELLLLGEKRNINQFSASLDGVRPVTVKAASVDITDQSLLTAEVSRTSIDTQGDTAVHDIVEAGTTLLTRTREEQNDIDLATQAAVDHSSWAYSANVEVIADNYGGVLSPYKNVFVNGAGPMLSGSWLISQVTHRINDENYKQAVTLRRNALSGNYNGIGDLAGGVF